MIIEASAISGDFEISSYSIITEYDDVLKCNKVGDTESPPVEYWIAKPYLLRKKSYSALSNYTYVNKNTRDVDDGSKEWEENITPEYLADDIIIAGTAAPNASSSTEAELWVDDSGNTQSGPGATPPDPPVNNLVELAELEGGSRIWEELPELSPDQTLLPDHTTDEAANIETWDVAAPNTSTDKGVSLKLLVDQKLSDVDQEIYNYYRILNFDSTGRLSTVELETREISLDTQVKYVVQTSPPDMGVEYDTDSGQLTNAYQSSLVFVNPSFPNVETNVIDTAEDC